MCMKHAISTAHTVTVVLGEGLFNHLDYSGAFFPFRFHICIGSPKEDRAAVVIVKDSFTSR